MRRVFLGAAVFTVIAALGAEPAKKVDPPDKGTCPAMRNFANLPPKAKSGEKFTAADCGSDQYSFLLATVPDPVNTHLALFFDRVVESIQNAISDAGFELAAYNFPWDPLLSREEPDIDKREKQQKMKKELEEEPGVLLFRAKAGDKRLAVLLVAEKPTQGINNQQFENARTYMGAGRVGQPPRLIGPTFSGSFGSLKILDPGKQLIFYSGTASSLSKRQEFAAWTPGHFHTFIHATQWAEDQLVQHIRKEWGNQGPIAILAEGETAFGAGLKAGQHQAGEEVDLIRFPREIAHLRNSYTPPTQLDAAAKNSPQNGQTLSLDLRDIGGGHDSIPALSAQTALSQEAVLFGIGSQLRQSRYSLIGILATNVLDAIFLGRFVRSICPDARVFVFEQDLLYNRATSDYPLYGTLSLVTYPVLLANQLSSPSAGNARIQFPDQEAEGVYNATTAALVNAGLTSGEAGRQLLDYAISEPTTNTPDWCRPPLWITVLGRNAYWPVALVESPADGPAKELADSTADIGVPAAMGVRLIPHAPGRTWSVIFFISSSGLIIFGWLVHLVHHVGVRTPANWLARLWVKPLELDNLHGRAYYLFAFAVAQALTYAILATPFWLLFWKTEWSREWTIVDWLNLALMCLAILVSLSVIIRFASFLQLPGTDRTMYAGRYRWMAGWTAALGAFIFVLIYIAFIVERPHREHIFGAWRSLDLFNGVAPVTPCILAGLGLCCWASVHLRRLGVFDERNALLPDVDFGALHFQFSDLRHRTDEAIRDPFHKAHLRSLGPVLTLLTVGIGELSSVQSFESKQYAYLYVVLLGLVLSALCLTLGRFWSVWSNLHNFLKQLERHPLRRAISDLPPELTYTRFVQRELTQKTFVLETRMMEIGEKLADEKCAAEGLSDVVAAIEDCMSTIAHGKRVPLSALRVFQERTQLLYPSAALLAKHGWAKGFSERLEKYDSKKPFEELTPAKRRERICGEFVAVPYVYYIRIALLQMRNLMAFLTLGSVLAWLSLNSYPFQSPRMLNALMVVVLAIIGLFVTKALAQISRDAILSRMTQTTPGKLDSNFLLHLASAVGLPLLTVIASQFPAISRFLFSWLEPTLAALK